VLLRMRASIEGEEVFAKVPSRGEGEEQSVGI
jgi:hypothetical protein